MKLICTEYNEAGDIAIIPVGDDSILRENNDFYFPEFTEQLSCIPQLVLRLNRLGKFVSEKFASRYYSEVGVSIRFYADTLEEQLLEQRLPSSMASAFIHSAAISPLVHIADRKLDLTMYLNGELIQSYSLEDMPMSIDRLISKASNYHTLKIGDFFFCGNKVRVCNLKIDDHIQVALDGDILLDFYIR